MRNLTLELETPIGPLYLVANDEGLSGVHYERPPLFTEGLGFPGDNAGRHLAQAAAELTEYFAGKRKVFSIPLKPAGTLFQQKVWAELARIPFGRTLSYAALARAAGCERAVRAVGTANGRNPLAIIVPCHRVIASDGSLGGYNGGLARKARLLEIERGSV